MEDVDSSGLLAPLQVGKEEIRLGSHRSVLSV